MDDVSSLYSPLVADSMSPADHEEYATIAWLDITGDLNASVDWQQRRRNIDVAAISVAPVEPHAHLNDVFLLQSPLLLNSGCTTHILPERSDFLMLKPISNCVVKGVNGSSISAIGIGFIKLVVEKGSHLTLENVLFIPSSTVHLLSIACITDSTNCNITFSQSFAYI